MENPFRCFKTSPEIIRLTVMIYIQYPLSLRQVDYLVFERAIDICYETVRYWWNLFGPIFAAEIHKRLVHSRSYSNWRWHLDEVFVRINGEEDLNAWMMLQGHAVAYRRYSKDYITSEEQAEAETRGIWSGEFTVLWLWRRGERLK